MIKVAVFFADGTEELEALTPVDLLRRVGASVDIVSVGDEFLTGSHGIIIKADKTIDKAIDCDYDALVIPGGMPGATNIAKNLSAMRMIENAVANKKLIASICASPAVVLASNNLLNGKKATCYPAIEFIKMMGENYLESDVVVSENLITANGPKSAFKFALEIISYLGLKTNF